MIATKRAVRISMFSKITELQNSSAERAHKLCNAYQTEEIKRKEIALTQNASAQSTKCKTQNVIDWLTCTVYTHGK